MIVTMSNQFDNLKSVELDYNCPSLPASVRLLKPRLLMSDVGFFCLLGENPRTGIYGCGISQQQALTDWVNRLKTRVQSEANDDPFVTGIAERMVEAKIDFTES